MALPTVDLTQDMLRTMLTQNGESVFELSKQQAVLLVFLRHFGCTFCREALADIAEQREQIEAKNTKIIFVHMSEYKIAERYFGRYELSGIDHVSDPTCFYYTAFGLTRGNLNQLFGLKSWIRGFEAGVLNGHSVGVKQIGDGFQMPGVFVIKNGTIKESFVHKLSSDRPDYEQLVTCCSV